MDLHIKIDELYNRYYALRYWATASRFKKKILLNNNTLHNIHKGERCFILGNGPSLRNETLQLLQGENVITVNQAYRNPNFVSISPRYHFWVDRNFFDIDEERPEDLELLECMKNCATSLDTICCFYPLEQYEFVKRHGLLIQGKTFFINPILRMGRHKAFNPDISKLTYSFGTVVQNAITAAVYMGFREIYLLGCDSTGIINTLNSALKKENDDYGYEVTDNEKKRMEKMVKKSKVTDYAYSYYMTLKGFDFLHRACGLQGVEIINCSSSTVLDMIPRLSLERAIENFRT